MSQTHSATGPETSSRVMDIEQEAPPWLNLPNVDDSDAVRQKTAILPIIPPKAFEDTYAASPIKRRSLDPQRVSLVVPPTVSRCSKEYISKTFVLMPWLKSSVAWLCFRRTPPDRHHKWFDRRYNRILLFDKAYEIPAGVLDSSIFGAPVPQYVFLVERDPGWRPVPASRWMYPTREPQQADMGKVLVDVCASRLPPLTPSGNGDGLGGVSTAMDEFTQHDVDLQKHNTPSNVVVVHGVEPAMRTGQFYRAAMAIELLSEAPPVAIALIEDQFYISFQSATDGRKAFGALQNMQNLLPNSDIQGVFTSYDEFETAFLLSTDTWVSDTDADADVDSRPIADATPVGDDPSHPWPGNHSLHVQLLEMEWSDGQLQAPAFQGSIDGHGQAAEWRPGDGDSCPVVDASSVGNDSSRPSPDEFHAQLLEMEATDDPLQAPHFQGSVDGHKQAPEWRPGGDTFLPHASLNPATRSEEMKVIGEEVVTQRMTVACQTEVWETPVPQRWEKACQTEDVPSLPAEVRGVACQTDFLLPPVPEVRVRHVNAACQTEELRAAVGTTITHLPTRETAEPSPLVLDVRHNTSHVFHLTLNPESPGGGTNLSVLEAVGAKLRSMMDNTAVQLAQEFHQSVEDMQDVVFAACRSVGMVTAGTRGMVANATSGPTPTIPPPVSTNSAAGTAAAASSPTSTSISAALVTSVHPDGYKTPRPPFISDVAPKFNDMKSQVVRGLRWGLQNATGEDTPLQWVNYERLIEFKHGWRIVGWPANTPIQNPSEIGASAVLALWEGLKSGSCYWTRVPDERMAVLEALYGSADADRAPRPRVRDKKRRTADGDHGGEQCRAKRKKKPSPAAAPPVMPQLAAAVVFVPPSPQPVAGPSQQLNQPSASQAPSNFDPFPRQVDPPFPVQSNESRTTPDPYMDIDMVMNDFGGMSIPDGDGPELQDGRQRRQQTA
ncbi:hypothetical protein B0H11DRAFT_1945609 [Mycena galericulata]|nr:hypothetical protein B0H11DRAFT_1945609 [Mycena galericulata]